MMRNKAMRKNEFFFSCFIQLIANAVYAAKDPLQNIISNYDNIKTVLNNKNDLNAIKILFFNNRKIHEILYEEDEIIHIECNDNKKDLAYNFYLNLLINENTAIINYCYTIKYIKEVNNQRAIKKGKYKIIFYSKCIIDLINNYRQTDEYNYNIDEPILELIEKENEEIIKKYVDDFHTFGLKYNYNDILKTKIDELYIEIINKLVTTKLDDYELIINIFEQLELINIDITLEMFKKLSQILNEKEYIKDYLITKIEDIYDEKRINFYYILMKYILKTSIFFYYFPFLIQTNIFFLKAINKKLINIYSEKNKKYIGKIEYIIKNILDSEYYWKIYMNNKSLLLKEVLKYYKEYKFESKKEDI